MDAGTEEDPQKKWMDNIREDCATMNIPTHKLLAVPCIGHDGEILFTEWAARARRRRHYCQGIKSTIDYTRSYTCETAVLLWSEIWYRQMLMFLIECYAIAAHQELGLMIGTRLQPVVMKLFSVCYKIWIYVCEGVRI